MLRPTTRTSYLTKIVILILLGWGTTNSCLALQPGDKIPAVTLTTAKGQKISLHNYAQEQKKRNLLLVFFRTGTCGICVGQLEEIAKQADHFGAENAAILALSLDDAIVQARTSETINNRYPILLDPDGKTVRTFGIFNPEDKLSRPSSFLIGPDHKILYSYVGKGLQDRPTTATLLNLVKHYSGLLPEDKRAVSGNELLK